MEINELIARLNTKASKDEHSARIFYTGISEEEKSLLISFSPQNSFIMYGTLGPGGPNHHLVKDIGGTWHKGLIKGKLAEGGWGSEFGYNGFRHDNSEEQQDIPASILIAENMPSNWKRLDEFEGDGYERILSKFELADGSFAVGYIYALR